MLGGHAIVEAVAAMILVASGAFALQFSQRRLRRPSRIATGRQLIRRDPMTAGRAMLLTAGAASAGASVIHLALAPDHFNQAAVLGAGFFLAAVFQAGWAVVALDAPKRRELIVGIAGNTALIAVWAASRTVGLPFGTDPWVPEAVERTDVVAVSLEVVVVVVSALLASGSLGNKQPDLLKTLVSVGVVPAVGLIAVATILALSESPDGSGIEQDHGAAPSSLWSYKLAERCALSW